ncbi:MAG: hypothetical protein HY707_10615 [Ignavibacteriae bacterium]|nr:hypothetical protein [Ignavibacteriota bacterium]
MVEPFQFYSKADQTVLLDKKAKNIRELLDGIKTVSGASIYFHTHKFLQQHHYLSPEPPNDFGYWITNVLNEEVLGEQISAIDIIQFKKIADLRLQFIEVIESYLQTAERIVDAPRGEEFHFMASQTFVYPTSYVAQTLSEFKEILAKISIHSLYFHIFDASLRLEQHENDFSNWFRRLGHTRLADEVLRLDPYTFTLEGLREKIIILIERYGKH